VSLLNSEESLRASSARLVDLLVEEYGHEALSRTAERLEAALALHIARSRANVRGLSYRTLRADLGLAPPTLVPVDVTLQGLTNDDVSRAMVVAKRHARIWHAKARASAQRVRKDKAAEAAEATQPRLMTIAATENAQAWSEEREAGLAQVAAVQTRERQREVGLVLVKTWDAALDKRTCRVCAGMDGMMRPVGMSFRGLSPGGVHPNCRCYSTVYPMPVTWAEEEGIDLGDEEFDLEEM
jgi:hypothetical protein